MCWNLALKVCGVDGHAQLHGQLCHTWRCLKARNRGSIGLANGGLAPRGCDPVKYGRQS